MRIIKPVRPMTYDKVFKNVLQDLSNEDYLIDLISRITKISKKEFGSNIVFKNTELINKENVEKTKIADLIIELDKSVINLEMNKKLYLGLVDKNDRYIYKIKEGLNYPGQKEIMFKRIIQINFDNYELFKDNDEVVLKFEMMNKKTGIVRSDYVQTSNVEIYHVNLKRVLQKYYNKEEMDILERELLIMILDNEDELRKVAKGDVMLEKVVDKIVTLSKEEELKGIYIKEDQDQWIRDRYKQEGLMLGREEGKKLGIEEGIKEGYCNKQKEIAKKMLEKGMDVNLVCELTGLSTHELN